MKLNTKYIRTLQHRTDTTTTGSNHGNSYHGDRDSPFRPEESQASVKCVHVFISPVCSGICPHIIQAIRRGLISYARN